MAKDTVLKSTQEDRVTPASATADTPEGNADAVVSQKTSLEVMVNSTQMAAAEIVQAAGGLPSASVLLDEIDRSPGQNIFAFPPECQSNKHPEFRFCWGPYPTTEVKRQQFYAYLDRGYRPCNRDTPAASFWSSFKGNNPRWRFDVEGLVRKQDMVLLVTHRAVFERVQEAEREPARLRKEKPGKAEEGGINNYGTDERNMPDALRRSSEMAATVEPSGEVAISDSLAAAFHNQQ